MASPRKKTTTGTMGSKRRTESKTRIKAIDKDVPASRVEAKASEVIPEVAIELITAHPDLPDQAAILAEFAAHYRAAGERATAEAQAAESARAPEPSETTPRRRRSTFQPPSGVYMRPVGIMPEPLAAAAPAPAEVPVAMAEEFASTAAESAAEVPLAADLAPEPSFDTGEDAKPLFELPEIGESEGIGAVLAESVSTPEDASIQDVFAMLEKRAEKQVDDDFDFSFQTAADQSNPFLTTSARASDEDLGTQILIAEEDDTATPAQDVAALPADAEPSDEERPRFAAPSESTTLMAAVVDEEPVEAEGGGAARKSRKSSKKRRG
jgi:hypothetical protein